MAKAQRRVSVALCVSLCVGAVACSAEGDDGMVPGPSDPDDPMQPYAAGWQSDVLNAHNEFRADHCAPALTWADDLASSAQAWADACVFAHDSGRGFGENLAGGSERPTELWYAESVDYKFTAPGFSSSTGHFTQVVWRASTKLGCGRAQCSFGVYYVCRYFPAGNVLGQFEQNVLPANSACD
jgi:uncharacterized protein YkwD